MTDPLVSVIINCLNGEKFLRTAIDSVYAQTYKNWELIFWDNASTDKTREIAESYDKKLKYFRARKTTILGEARVKATRNAKGKYLAFLDADDSWTEDKLEKQILLFSTNKDKLGFVYGRAQVVFDGQVKKTFVLQEGENLLEGDVFTELLKSNFVVFSSLIVDRKKFYECGGFPTNFLHSTDYYILTRLAKKFKCSAVQNVCCTYMIHEKSLSKKQRIISVKEAISVISYFLPDPRVENGLKNYYAHLALVYMRELKFFHAKNVIFQHRCGSRMIYFFYKRLIRIFKI